MSNIKYEELHSENWKEWLISRLQQHTRMELHRMTGIPYGCINNKFNQLSAEEQALCQVGRFHWTLKEKLRLVKLADKQGYAVTAAEAGIDRSHLSHWKSALIASGDYVPKEKPPKILTKKRRKRRSRK